MAKMQPWSFSHLSDFKNCPHAFNEKKDKKKYPREETEAMTWGNEVHKHFENYHGTNTPLPKDLLIHKGFLDKIAQHDAVVNVEMMIGLNKQGKPCHFFDKDVWYRGKLDFHVIRGDVGDLVDYKTGKVKEDWEQLALFAIWMFQMYPDIRIVNAQYYFTTTGEVKRKVWGREEIPKLWKMVTPDLQQYLEAHKTDTWQKRQSGLCAGWCPVTECEFWKPKRVKR